jgi:type IV pilus assembly protein PilB
MDLISTSLPTSIPLRCADVDAITFGKNIDLFTRLQCLPTLSEGILLQLGMVDPYSEYAFVEIRNHTHQEVRAFGITLNDFETALTALNSNLVPCAEILIQKSMSERPKTWGEYSHARSLVLEIIRLAFNIGASDVFIDQQELWTEVAMKVSGQKEILPPLVKDVGCAAIKAVKEMAGITTQGSQSWQSGFARCAIEDKWAELRVEITPTVHGESVVARIQNRSLQIERMKKLPFYTTDHRILAEQCLAQRQGLILATGPTGHGKTTTLYSCLGQLDHARLNIRTLEDPVEFTIPWITQIPVGSGTPRTYADGLKSLLRQAPHVILMGEIRDAEVAQTCIEAVDTGHLILATLHTRDVIGVVSRLMDLGLSGRCISTALSLVISQRLMRKLCPECKEQKKVDELQSRYFRRYDLVVPDFLWVGKGCRACGGMGEKGVIPVFELLKLSSHFGMATELAKSDRKSFDETKLRHLWLNSGGLPLMREALLRVSSSEISFKEAIKYDFS